MLRSDIMGYGWIECSRLRDGNVTAFGVFLRLEIDTQKVLQASSSKNSPVSQWHLRQSADALRV